VNPSLRRGSIRARIGMAAGAAALLAASLAVPASTSAASAVATEFQVQPGGGAIGTAWAQQPVVKIVDAQGNTDTSNASSVTLQIHDNSAGGTLTCDGGNTRTAVAGVATFSGCSIDKAGTGLTLVGAATGLLGVVSNPFDVVNNQGPAPHLAFTVAATSLPLTGTSGGPLNFSFHVEIRDATDQVITTDPIGSLPVTLGMAANSVGAQVTCTGGLTVNAVAGVATWPGCSVSPAGTGLAFTATVNGFPTATSQTFNILAGGATPTLTITASKTAILWGDGIDLSIHLAAPSGAATSVAGVPLHVQVARVNAAGAFSTIDPGGDVTTDANGNATISNYTPATNLWYQVVFDGSTSLGPVISPETRVVVRQLAAIRPTNNGVVKTIAKNTDILFRTTVRPSRDDVPRTHVTWQIWRLVNNRWTLFSTQKSDPDESGNAYFGVTFNTGGWRIRSQADPTQLNANSVWTPFETFTVK
jgi:hypothetical protein